MTHDSGFEKNGGDGNIDDVRESETLAGPMSCMRPMSAASGAYRLQMVQDMVDQALGPHAAILQKIFTENPKSRILWDVLLNIGADAEVIQKRLTEIISPSYFFNLVKDYLTTLYVALEVRSEDRKNVHVLQHKDDMREAAEAFALTKDRKTAVLMRSEIRTAVIEADK